MEQITIGQVALGITFIVGIISGIGFLSQNLKKWVRESMSEPLENITREMRSINQRINEVDQNACKNFLVARLAELEKGSVFDDIEAERFWEQYEHYTETGGNSYIKRKVEQLKSEGKL